ncbi:MAG: IS3 family transposase [Rhodobacteraceae bacterium]|nr:IS3 family transposase [Paracoccaceae bacterium]
MERRLAAVLAADVVGYSRLVGEDEASTISALKTLRTNFIEPLIAAHRGRIVKLMGDGFLVEFQSVVNAVECAIDWQAGRAAVSGEMKFQFRIGINSGDIVIDEGDIHGDGVNVAARLEGLAEPGGIALSQLVHDQVVGKVNATFEDSGEHSLKNIARPVRVYRVRAETSETDGDLTKVDLSSKPAIAVLPFDNMSGDPEQDYFTDGITEDIITALSLWRSFPVIARNSSFTYKEQKIDAQRVGRELGVRYVLEGSVRKAGNRVRITASMSSTGNCYDNAVVESFFGALKRERVNRVRYRTREQARADLFEYIEVFYNRKRRHGYLGNISPDDFERQSVGSF